MYIYQHKMGGGGTYTEMTAYSGDYGRYSSHHVFSQYAYRWKPGDDTTCSCTGCTLRVLSQLSAHGYLKFTGQKSGLCAYTDMGTYSRQYGTQLLQCRLDSTSVRPHPSGVRTLWVTWGSQEDDSVVGEEDAALGRQEGIVVSAIVQEIGPHPLRPQHKLLTREEGRLEDFDL